MYGKNDMEVVFCATKRDVVIVIVVVHDCIRTSFCQRRRFPSRFRSVGMSDYVDMVVLVMTTGCFWFFVLFCFHFVYLS